MSGTHELSMVWVVVVPFASVFACASFLSTPGKVGFLALAGIVGVAMLMFSYLDSGQLLIGFTAAFFGLVAGGTVNTRREAERVKAENTESNRRRRKG